MLLLDTDKSVQFSLVLAIRFVPVAGRVDPMRRILGECHERFGSEEFLTKVVNSARARVDEIGGAQIGILAVVIGTFGNVPPVDAVVIRIGRPEKFGFDPPIRGVHNILGHLCVTPVSLLTGKYQGIGLLFLIEKGSKEFDPFINGFVGGLGVRRIRHIEQRRLVSAAIIVKGHNVVPKLCLESIYVRWFRCILDNGGGTTGNHFLETRRRNVI